MTITSLDDFISMAANGDHAQDGFYSQIGAATASFLTNQNFARQLHTTRARALPSLPVGKTFFFPTSFEVTCTAAKAITLCKLTLLGSLDISGASGTFTVGSSAPTVTEGGISRQVPSSVLVAVRTTLSATPGNFTFTYVDQDNNSPQVSPSITLTGNAAAGSAGFAYLNSPDWGVLSITAASRTAGTTPTGVLDFYHVTPLGNVVLPLLNIMGSINFLTDLVCLHKLGAGDALAFLNTGTTVNGIQGRINYGVL